ncbi:tetratricopeptide repeat protein [Bradyrhizobium sp. CNPSo 4010]|uniref:Tetratricopeptide repeat protein n=1 Tax=Bradyrhizobium agreste TaxID=2751811 RepID=A0ABS0PN41_9BRAD|nr:tetratricopeptide repeat protein [Bradyrhizobium agreste]MBH5398598.1 tetratricopeptide repeat protein [Bradyrhizobium agreste]
MAAFFISTRGDTLVAKLATGDTSVGIFRRYFSIPIFFAAQILIITEQWTKDNALAADAAEDTRSISRVVSELIRQRNWSGAETLAKMGLTRCDEVVGTASRYCLAGFHDSLGDIDYLQARYSEALSHYQKSLDIRRGIPGTALLGLLRSQLRIGRSHLALRHFDQAEPLLIETSIGLSRVAPADPDIGTAFRALGELYYAIGKPVEEAAVARREFDFHTRHRKDPGLLRDSRRRLNAALIRQARQSSGNNSNDEAERIFLEALHLVDPPQPGEESHFINSLEDLGLLYQKLRRYADAEPLFLRALDYAQRFYVPSDPNLAVALLNLAGLEEDLGKHEECIRYASQSIQKFDEAKVENLALGLALDALGSAYGQLGRASEAERAHIRAIDVVDRVLAEGAPQRIKVRMSLGSTLIAQERFREAEQLFQLALQMDAKLATPSRDARSIILGSLGLIYREQARYDDAVAALLKAIETDKAGGAGRSQDAARHYTELAGVYRRQSRYDEAEAALLKSLAIEQPELGRATALNSLGLIHMHRAQYDKAESELNQALAIRTKLLSENSRWTAETLGNLATLDDKRGLTAEAEAKFRRVLAVINSSPLSQSTTGALYSLLLSENLLIQGKLDEAETFNRVSLDLYKAKLGPEHPRYAGALKVLGSIEMARGRNGQAEDHYRQALAIDEKILGPQSEAVAADLTNLAELLRRVGKRPEARANLERALAIYADRFGNESPVITGALLTSANLAWEEAHFDAARALASRARGISERSTGPDQPPQVSTIVFLARVDLAQDKLDDARLNLDRATRIVDNFPPADHALRIELLIAKAEVELAADHMVGAENHVRDALAMAKRLYQPDFPTRRNAIDRLSGLLFVQGKFDEAVEIQRAEFALTETQLGSNHPATAVALRSLAATTSSSGDQAGAIELLRRALAIDEQSFGPQSDQAASNHLALGSLLRRMGRLDEARSEINAARKGWEALGHVLRASVALDQLALIAIAQTSPTEAIVFSERVQNILEDNYGRESPVLLANLAQLGRLRLRNGDTQAAVRILARTSDLIGPHPSDRKQGYRNFLQLRAELSATRKDFEAAATDLVRAVEISAKYGGRRSAAVGENSFNLALVYLEANRFRESMARFSDALEIFKRENGDHSPSVGYSLLGAAQAYEKLGDKSSSRALLAAAAEILGQTTLVSPPQLRWL